IYNCELEEVPEFHGFQDFCQTFQLYRGKVQDDDPVVGGEFKGLFRIYPLPEDPRILPPPRQFQELPANVSMDCLVRVYIIRAFNLQPKDLNGLIKLGKERMDDREEYIPNTLDPVFGRAGPTQWRDQLLPSELLENHTQAKNLPQTEISEDGSKAIFMETKLPSHGYLGPAKERMALHLLRTCGLVSEHIETRTLYDPALPGIDQVTLNLTFRFSHYTC
ncbi:hypothetical protein Chor_002224, partial [Crotalus horridus]